MKTLYVHKWSYEYDLYFHICISRIRKWRRWKPSWKRRWRCGDKWKWLLRRANHKDNMLRPSGTSSEACTMLAWWRRGLMDNIILSMIQMNRSRSKKNEARSRSGVMLSRLTMMMLVWTLTSKKGTLSELIFESGLFWSNIMMSLVSWTLAPTKCSVGRLGR